MQDQHSHIKGYRDLNQMEIDLINEVKEHEAKTRQLIFKVREHIAAKQTASESLLRRFSVIEADEEDQKALNAAAAEITRIQTAQPMRWAALAETDIQIGFMCLVRSIAQPQS